MENIRFPSVHHYWQTDSLYHPVFSETMARDRFISILSSLSFNGTNDRTMARLNKVQNFITPIFKNIQNVYKPSQVRIFHLMSLCCCGMHDFNLPQRKKNKYSIKFYELTTSDGF